MADFNDPTYIKHRDALLAVWHPRDFVMPAPTHDELWNMLCDDLLKVENKADMRLRARLWACAILNTATLMAKARRSAFLKALWRSQEFTSSLRRLFSIAMTERDDPLAKPPSLPTMRQWFEDYDVPHIDDFDPHSKWHTVGEYVTLAREWNVPDMPKTVKEMRKLLRTQVEHDPHLRRERE